MPIIINSKTLAQKNIKASAVLDCSYTTVMDVIKDIVRAGYGRAVCAFVLAGSPCEATLRAWLDAAPLTPEGMEAAQLELDALESTCPDITMYRVIKTWYAAALRSSDNPALGAFIGAIEAALGRPQKHRERLREFCDTYTGDPEAFARILYSPVGAKIPQHPYGYGSPWVSAHRGF